MLHSCVSNLKLRLRCPTSKFIYSIKDSFSKQFGVDEKLVPITKFFKKEARMEHMNSIGERNPQQDETNFEVGNRTMAD